MSKSIEIAIALGSNIGDRKQHIRQAIVAIQKISQTTLICESDLFETIPVGPIEQDLFINAAVVVQTELDAQSLLKALTQVEKQAGRDAIKNRVKWGPRIIDLDIIFFSDQIINNSNLIIPHPQMHLRSFVLAPLAQIAPQWKHPVLKQTVAQMLSELEA